MRFLRVRFAERHADAVPAWAARLVTLGALWTLLSVPPWRPRWTHWIDDLFSIVGVPVGSSLFLICLLLLLAGALRRRMRVARLFVLVIEWLTFTLATLSLVLIATVPSVRDGLAVVDLVSVILTEIGAALVLVFFHNAKRAFPARTRPGSLRTAVAVLIGGLAASVLVTFGLTMLAPRHLDRVGQRFGWSVRAVLGLRLHLTHLNHEHLGHRWIAFLGGLLGALAVLGATAFYLRAAHRAEVMSAADELRLRRLVDLDGDLDSLSYFATRRDKSVVFSADGRSAVAFRVVGSVCLASGDPLGPVAAWPEAIRVWLDLAHANAWRPAVIAAGDQSARAYIDAGLRGRLMGDEAIIDVDTFNLELRQMRPVKRALARVLQSGATITVQRHDELSPEELSEFEKLADVWRTEGEAERGFSMALNRFGDRADGRCVIVVVRNKNGEPEAFQSFVPWGRRGLSLDLMRRSPTATNGVNEAIVSTLVARAGDFGVRRISLNFAMFRAVFADADKVGAGLLTKLTDRVLSIGDRYWQLESLYRSNAKYLPTWSPRYLCFESSADLPLVAAAAGSAEGFLPGRPPKITRGGEDLEPDADGNLKPFADLVLEQDRELLAPVVPIQRLTDQERVRRAKIGELAEAGMAAYPVSVPRTNSIAEARALPPGTEVSLTGRVRAMRDLGGVAFAVLEERDCRIQALLSADAVPRDQLRLWQHTVDLGDHVSVTGRIGRSRRGELSVLVTSWAMASKCLRPLPESLTDPETRMRQRYLDLIVNRDSMALLDARWRAVAELRQAFFRRGFVEVETPMLQTIHGGANARPFRTHINAYDEDLYLRIAPELFLKQLCVGGMSRIFELNRNFRNEGADATHNPEFTSVEAYAAYEDYESMRVLTRELILDVAVAIHGEPVAVRPGPDGNPERIRLDHEWEVLTVHEAVSRATGVELTTETSRDTLREVAEAHHVHFAEQATDGEIVAAMYDDLIEKQTVLPTFYTDFPVETSPLTRVHRSNPKLSERWDLVAFGAEIGTAYSELIDPIDQRGRLTAQSLKAAAGDAEAMEVDEGFLAALEYAMPPTGGLGVGVDRLVMMLVGANIRATLAFPFVKPGS